MSIGFILGERAESRSKLLYKRAIEASKDSSKKVYIIVPEQFTLETQKGIITAHPKHAILNIDVVSFNRLAYKILSKVGSDNAQIISESSKSMLIRKLIRRHASNFQFFSNKVKKRGFVSELKSIISELEQYNISEEALKGLKEHFNSPADKRISSKLADIHLIYSAYKTEMKEKFISSEELLLLLVKKLNESNFLKGADIILDGFTGFTPIQYKLIESLMGQASNMYFSVIYDMESPRPNEDNYTSGNLFFMSDNMMNRLSKLADYNGQNITYTFDKVYRKEVDSSALTYLQANIFRNKNASFAGENKDINLLSAADAKEEISYIISKIYDLTREENLRYRDIAIVTEDVTSYSAMACKMFKEAGIPLFIDHKKAVSENPYIEHIRAALKIILKGYSYSNVFTFVKNTFLNLDSDYIDELENYCLALGIDNKSKWTKDWERKSKRDFSYVRNKKSKKENLACESYYDFERLNDLRKQIVSPLEKLNESLKEGNKAKDKVAAIRDFLIYSGAYKRLEEIEDDDSLDLIEKDLYRQLYKKIEEIFNQIIAFFGEEDISVEEFTEMIDVAFEELAVAFIPPSIDCLTLGDVERTRLTDIKALFILGANDGLLPKTNEESGLLTNAERFKLEAADNTFNLAPTSKEKSFIQKFYLYLLFTKPFNSLHISFARKDRDGKALMPSYLISTIKKIIPTLQTQAIGQDIKKESLLWLPNKKIELVGKKAFLLSSDSLFHLYGNNLKGSVSSFERFALCPFSYFMGKGLRLEKRERYTFEPADFGNIVHEILKDAFDKASEEMLSVDALTNEELSVCIEHAIKPYVILFDTARNTFIADRIKELVSRSLQVLGRQLSVGNFKTRFSEYSFVKDLKKVDKEKSLSFLGTIDRLDVADASDKAYVRIIDYKTGTRQFDLAGLYEGSQLQLTAYMKAALEVLKKDNLNAGKDLIPAGMHYYVTDNPLVEVDDISVEEEKIKEAILKDLRLTGPINSEIISDAYNAPDNDKDVKLVLKACGERNIDNKFTSKQFEEALTFVDNKLISIAEDILDGNASISPIADSINVEADACRFCDFKAVCNFNKDYINCSLRKRKVFNTEDLWAKIEESNKKTLEKGEENE